MRAIIGDSALAALALAAIAALLVAGAIATFYAQRARRQARACAALRRIAAARREKLADALRLLARVEQAGEFGLWRYFPEEGRQIWSRGFERLFGVEQEDRLDRWDADTLLRSNGIDLIAATRQQTPSPEGQNLRFAVLSLEGRHRVLEARYWHCRPIAGRGRSVVALFRDASASETDGRRSAREWLDRAPATHQRAIARSRELAGTDRLTGLCDRRRAMEELDRMILSAQSAGEPLALILMRIDRFDRFVRAAGQAQGEMALKIVAEVIRSQAREADVLARVGEDEFLCIVPMVDASYARIIAERLRASVHAASRAGVGREFTVSVGCACHAAGEGALALFARADRALIEACHAGTNAVRVDA